MFLLLLLFVFVFFCISSLGGGPDDAKEVMQHPFFNTINWEDIFNKRVSLLKYIRQMDVNLTYQIYCNYVTPHLSFYPHFDH